MANHGYMREGYGLDDDRERSERERRDRDFDRDEDRGRRGMMFGDDDRSRFGGRDTGGGDDRGFFERAGEHVRSWFSDEDDHRRSPGREDWERDRESGWRTPQSSWRDSRSGGTPQGWGSPTAQDERYRSGRSAGDEDSREWMGGREWAGARDRHQGQHRRPSLREDSPGFGDDFGGTLGGFGNQQSARPAGFASSQDDHYRSWRDRQIAELDRDYQDYCRDREQKFHSDFDSWRRTRQPSGQQGGEQAGQGGLTMPGEASGGGGTTGSSGGSATGRPSGSASSTPGGADGGPSGLTGGTQITGEKIDAGGRGRPKA